MHPGYFQLCSCVQAAAEAAEAAEAASDLAEQLSRLGQPVEASERSSDKTVGGTLGTAMSEPTSPAQHAYNDAHAAEPSDAHGMAGLWAGRRAAGNLRSTAADPASPITPGALVSIAITEPASPMHCK